DEQSINYLKLTNRGEWADRAEAYFKAQDLWYDGASDPEFSDTLELDLGHVEPSLAGPSRPQDRVALSKVRNSFRQALYSRFENEIKATDEIKNWIQDTGSKNDYLPELNAVKE